MLKLYIWVEPAPSKSVTSMVLTETSVAGVGAMTIVTTVDNPVETKEDVTKVGNREVAASTIVTAVIVKPELAHVAKAL